MSAKLDTRDDQILRLLDTRFDNLPESTRRDHSSSGFVHDTVVREACEDCLANDRPRFGCETCGGRGFIEKRRARDPYAIDQKVLPFGLDGSERERVRAIESAISVAERELKRFPGFRPSSSADEIEDANQHPYAWETARRSMYAEFDYAALDRALELLHHARPGESPRGTFGLRFLSAKLPDPLRAPPPPKEVLRVVGKVERGAGPGTREVRDNQIRMLADQGLKPVEIAVQCHVSIRTVYNIVNAGQAA